MVDGAKEEIWNPYPEFDFIEASSLGRIRTKDRVVNGKDGNKYHIKGRILKQQLDCNGYLFVNFRVNGKFFNRKVHRIILPSFRENPDNLPEVNHIDCDRTNNCLDNLEWCTRQYNMAYKEKYGISAAKALGMPVIAVNLKTGKIFRFESRSEAARQLNIANQDICAVMNGRLKTAGGCWFTEDESEITDEKIQKIKTEMQICPVTAVNLETGKVLHFESQHEASRQLGVRQSSISRVIKGELNQVGGYLFTKNESEITDEKIQEIKSNMHFRGGVIAVNLQTKEVLHFKSQAEASRKLVISNGHICNVLKGKRNTAGGFWFCYDDENAVEKVRSKFGDDVAEKVEGLNQNQN